MRKNFMFLIFFGLGIGWAQTQLPDGPPKLLDSVTPEYPVHLKEQRVVGSAQIICLIDENGSVKDAAVDHAALPEFGQAALAAVRQFKYQPAVKNGQRRAIKVAIPIEFSLGDGILAELEARRTKEPLPPGLPIIAAKEVDILPMLKKEIRPKTPEILKQSRQLGQTVMGFIVDERGVPRDVHAIVTTHAECAKEALAVITQWRFSPATKDGKAVRTAIELPLVFFPEDTSANGARVKPGVSSTLSDKVVRQAQAAEGGNFTPPRPRKQQSMEFPEEMAIRGQTGRVVVEFVINPHGEVCEVQTMDKTNAFFSTLAERAVSHWTFIPAKKDGVPVYCHVKQLIEFQY
jgi:protein TonB